MDITIENRLFRKRQATALSRRQAAAAARTIAAYGQTLVARVPDCDLFASSGRHELAAAVAQLASLQAAVTELAAILPEIIVEWDVTE